MKGWLFGARPFDYGPWCLAKALEASEARVAAFYLGELLECVFDGGYSGGLTVERVRARLSGNAALLDLLDERMRRVEESAPQGGGAHGREPTVDKTEQIEWQQVIAAHAQELRAGRGEPRLLHRIAEVYLGIDKDVKGTTPSGRLANLVGSRSDLVAVLQGGWNGWWTGRIFPIAAGSFGCLTRTRLISLCSVDCWARQHRAIRATKSRRTTRRSGPSGSDSLVHPSGTIPQPRDREGASHVSAGVVSDRLARQSGTGG